MTKFEKIVALAKSMTLAELQTVTGAAHTALLDLAAMPPLDFKKDPFSHPMFKTFGRGDKIKAIKLYRELTQSGLADAKDAVEKRMPQLEYVPG